MHTLAECQVYRSWLQHEAFAQSKRHDFLALPELDVVTSELTRFALASLDQPTSDEEQGSSAAVKQVLVLVGERGSGKSSVLAQWAHHFRLEYNFLPVFTHHIESGAPADDVRVLMRRCVAFFSDQLVFNFG